MDAVVQLRTQFDHLDALNEESKRMANNQSRKPEDRAKEDRAEDVNMVIKDSGDNDQAEMYGGMNETSSLLRAMRDEPWQRLQWVESSVG